MLKAYKANISGAFKMNIDTNYDYGLREQPCILELKSPFGFMTIESACISGNLNILKMAHLFGYDFEDNYVFIFKASANGHVHILNWFKGLKCEFQYDELTILLIICRKKYNVLRWYVKTFEQKIKLNKNIDYYIHKYDFNDGLKVCLVLSRFGIKIKMKNIFKLSRHVPHRSKKYLILYYYKIKKRYFKGYKKN